MNRFDSETTMRPHRAQLLLILACAAFVFSPCGLIALILCRRDLKAMDAGTMDPQGRAQTKLARTVAIVAGIIWMIKTAILIVVGVIVWQWYYQ